jgi:hypothetical protein
MWTFEIQLWFEIIQVIMIIELLSINGNWIINIKEIELQIKNEILYYLYDINIHKSSYKE